MPEPLAIIGEEDIVLGFKALGFKTYPVRNPVSGGLTAQDFAPVLAEVARLAPAVCLIQEEIYEAHKEEIGNYRPLALPVFISFTKNIQNALLEKTVKDIRMRATGKI